MKRVAALYRVSTKGQLDDNDIPMQQRSCRNFIDNNNNWKLVKEYTEKGISGFKVSADKRDAIQQAKEDAENGLFDVLLVFMFDRLGRRESETPFVLEWFVEHGIEMWSVIEGHQKIEQYTDRLTNYIRFWQSSGESRKTSERVNEKHSQMVEDGIFRGGGIPYGYRGVDSGKVNKKGKPLLKLMVDEKESEIVKMIYELALKNGYGQTRIAKYLNDKNIPAKKTSKWGAPTISVILKNPIYKGVMRYRGKVPKFSQPLNDLIIISPNIWETVQIMRDKKNPKKYNKEQSNLPMSTRSKALLVGMIRCDCCKSRMTTSACTNKYKLKSGEVKISGKTISYRCTGKQQGKQICNGKSTYSSKKIDGLVLENVFDYLDELGKVNFCSKIECYRMRHIYKDEKELEKLQLTIETKYSELRTLQAEVPNALMGNSAFGADLLSKLINEKDIEISALQREIETREDILRKKRIDERDLEELKDYIAVWKDTFEKESVERKKIMLSKIIDNVFLSKDRVNVEFKIHLREFSEGIHS